MDQSWASKAEFKVILTKLMQGFACRHHPGDNIFTSQEMLT